MDAEVRQQAVVAYARANDNKWNSVQAIMGQLGDQRDQLRRNTWGPTAYVNTTTGGKARYLDAPDDKGGRGAVASAGFQPGKINSPSAEDVAQIFSASRPGRSVANNPSPMQQQISDAMGGAASGTMAQMNADISKGAELNEMANKTAASQQGLDLAQLAMGMGAKDRAVKQELDKNMVAGILPAMSAKIPPVLQQGLKKAYNS